ncbi:MAG TPA: FAD:protein FMN transferase [Candidatus Saccharimonadaceae bacterium]|nr:FAD:protein FMN transferase [Candidatus Saccharimonadaceae bacterium]
MIRRAFRTRAVLAASALLVSVAFSSVAAKGPARRPGLHDTREQVEGARELMGTTCTVSVESRDSQWSRRCMQEAFDTIADLDSVLSSWREDSELSHVNAAGAETRIGCSEPFYACLDSALVIAAETNGAFDPTVEPLNRVWDLRGDGRVPEPGELADARALVGFHLLSVVPGARTVRFPRPGMGLDFGGIGKGFALDAAMDQLYRRGVKRALVNLGGQISTFTDGEAWTVQIADPADRLKPAVRLVVRRTSISTSSQSEHHFTANGRDYGHILDPRRGEPVNTNASVTVLAPSGTRADGLSTAFLVMGRDAVDAYLDGHPEIGALWMEPTQDGIRAWRWHLATVSVEPGIAVQWMN